MPDVSPFWLLCRKFKVISSDTPLLGLAGPKLMELMFDPKNSPRLDIKKESAEHIGQLTTVTRLELLNFTPFGRHPAYFESVRALQLQELVLLYCQGLEINIFTPGALTSLRRLHIRESKRSHNDAAQRPELIPCLDECATVLLALPHLEQVSGSCPLFSSSMRDVLATWERRLYSTSSMTFTHDAERKRLRNLCLSTWNKPGV